MIKDVQQKIMQLKAETDTCILAHSYMTEEVCEVADFVGDSYALSVKAKSVPQSNILMCGVRFMAETVKLLSPQKNVILCNRHSGCPMAEQMDRELILQVKQRYPDYAVVAYINTTASLKTIADVCVTSSSAVKICRAIPQKNIIFIPDKNLGEYVKSQIPEKNFLLLSGGCPTHARMEERDILQAKSEHPKALFAVHPECRPEVVKYADFIGSTKGICDFVINSDKKEFIIGTETSIVEHLGYACPDKRIYPLSKDLVCHNMRLVTLIDILSALEGRGGECIQMDEKLRVAASRCIEKMIEYGG